MIPLFNFDGGPTMLEWLGQLCGKVNEIIANVNNFHSVPPGGYAGQVLGKRTNDDYDTEWVDQTGGGGGGGGTVSVDVGDTVTGEPGTDASVTNAGTDTHVVLNFTIPRGEPGAQGPAGPAGADGKDGKQGPQGIQGPPGHDGAQGPAGEAATISVSETVTGEPGTEAAVENVGTANAASLRFTIPRGEPGAQGPAGPAGADGQDGERGPQGIQGPPGQDGAQGPAGPAGQGVPTGGTAGQVLAKKSATDYDTEWVDQTGGGGGGGTVSVDVGDTVTGDPGTDADVTNAGTDTHVVLNFTIPRGEPGAQGPAGPAGADGQDGERGPQGIQGPPGQDGAQGPAGEAATISVSETVTGEPGTEAAVENVGTANAASLKFTIPRGEPGAQGPAGPAGADGKDGKQGPQGIQGPPGRDGAQGPAGPAGQGVPTGGTAGQVLAKKSATDYDTEWVDQTGGGGGGGTEWEDIELSNLTPYNIVYDNFKFQVDKSNNGHFRFFGSINVIGFNNTGGSVDFILRTNYQIDFAKLTGVSPKTSSITYGQCISLTTQENASIFSSYTIPKFTFDDSGKTTLIEFIFRGNYDTSKPGTIDLVCISPYYEFYI